MHSFGSWATPRGHRQSDEGDPVQGSVVAQAERGQSYWDF